MTALTTEIYNIVRREEGGLANIPGDTGGLTNYGVTHVRYDEYRRTRELPLRSVRDIEESEVLRIYEEYWQEASCDLLLWPLNIAHFAFSFNAGVRQGIKLLQRSLNVDSDGFVGPITRHAIELAISTKSLTYIAAYRLLLEQVFFYDSLDEGKPEKTKFVTGFWLKRLRNIYREIDKEDSKERV